MNRSARPSVTIICANVGGNPLGRALLLAELCKPEFEPIVIGAQDRPEIWSPASSFDTSIEGREVHHVRDYWSTARWLASRSKGSRVIVCKPMPTSLGLALMAGIPPRQILLDIDDFDPEFTTSNARRLRFLLHPRELNTYHGMAALFRTVRHFPRRLVSNEWLQSRYGGTFLTHVRDTDVLDPARHDGRALRSRLQLADIPWVGFIGTVRPHKGIDDLIDAMQQLTARCPAGLLLAGLDSTSRHGPRLIERARATLGDERLRVLPSFPFAQLPEVLALPDILCIPSRLSIATHGQIPAKLFDGMAMGKPVLISDAHPIESIPSDCVARFSAGKTDALVDALASLCLDPQAREQLGRRARSLAIERFSYAAARPALMAELRALPAFG